MAFGFGTPDFFEPGDSIRDPLISINVGDQQQPLKGSRVT